MGQGRTPPCSQLRELSVLVGRGLWLREMAGSFPWKLLTVPVYSSPSAKRMFPWEWLPWPGLCALLRAQSDHSPIHPAWTEAGTWKRAAQGHSMAPGNQHSMGTPPYLWDPHCPEPRHTPDLVLLPCVPSNSMDHKSTQPVPPLTNHQSRGLEVGVKGTTALAILQEDIAGLILG